MSLRPWAEQPNRVINLVRMSPRTRFLLVEGRTDHLFLRRHVDYRVGIECLGGRAEVSDACRTLEQTGANNFLGLIDADFDHVVGLATSCSRLVYVSLAETESESTIDLESTLIRTRALRQVCGEALGNRIRELGGPLKFSNTVRESLRVAVAAVGAFRAAVMSVFAERRVIQPIGELSDEEWTVFVEARTGTLDRPSLESVMQSRVRNVLTFPEVRQRARDYEATWGSGWLLCRGHDLTQLLAIRLSNLCGRLIEAVEVEAMLRNAYAGKLDEETAFGRRLRRFWME
jgi:hypothetical protein